MRSIKTAKKIFFGGIAFILVLFMTIILYTSQAYANSAYTDAAINNAINSGWTPGSAWVQCGPHFHNANGEGMGVNTILVINGYRYDLTNGECGERHIGNPDHVNYLWPGNCSGWYWGNETSWSAMSGETWVSIPQSLGAGTPCPGGACFGTNSPWVLTRTWQMQALWGVVSEPAKLEITTNYRTVLVKVNYKSDKDHNGGFDDTGQSLEYIYNKNTQSSTYERTTSIGSLSDSNNVQGIVWTIEQKHYKTHQMGHVVSEYNEYRVTSSTNLSRTFTYNVEQPTYPVEKYTPFNLNRSGYATGSDISGFQPGDRDVVDGLAGSVSNAAGERNNNYIDTLDVNNDSTFNLSLTSDSNHYLGLRGGYDKWNNKPDTWTTGDKEMVRGESYAKGLNNGATDKNFFRYNTDLYGGVSDIIGSSQQLTSLFDWNSNTEYLSNVDYNIGKNRRAVYNNTFGARAIISGQFNTCNNQDSEYKNWWILSWNVGRYYEYGIHYVGTISVNGISDPSQAVSNNGVASEWNYNSSASKLTTNCNAQHRGLYVRFGATTQENPVLYGKWNVNTIAGNLK